MLKIRAQCWFGIVYVIASLNLFWRHWKIYVWRQLKRNLDTNKMKTKKLCLYMCYILYVIYIGVCIHSNILWKYNIQEQILYHFIIYIWNSLKENTCNVKSNYKYLFVIFSWWGRMVLCGNDIYGGGLWYISGVITLWFYFVIYISTLSI